MQLIALQWGPVVVTGIRVLQVITWGPVSDELQWGPVVVTGIRFRDGMWRGPEMPASMGSGRGDRNQACNSADSY